MATKVAYKQGLKATYLGLKARDPNALYFCTDTKELYRGDSLYSDGVRLVANEDALPSFTAAADGILYFCTENGSGYVLNAERNAWLPVLNGVDGETLALNSNGLMYVLAVPLTSVTGLAERLQEIEALILNGGGSGTIDGLSPVATATLNEEQFEIVNNVINLIAVDAAIVTCGDKTLDAILDDIYAAIIWEDMA